MPVIFFPLKKLEKCSSDEVQSIKLSAWDMLVKPLEDPNTAPNTYIVILKCLDKIS